MQSFNICSIHSNFPGCPDNFLHTNFFFDSESSLGSCIAFSCHVFYLAFFMWNTLIYFVIHDTDIFEEGRAVGLQNVHQLDFIIFRIFFTQYLLVSIHAM